jgi:hypothetical protein
MPKRCSPAAIASAAITLRFAAPSFASGATAAPASSVPCTTDPFDPAQLPFLPPSDAFQSVEVVGHDVDLHLLALLGRHDIEINGWRRPGSGLLNLHSTPRAQGSSQPESRYFTKNPITLDIAWQSAYGQRWLVTLSSCEYLLARARFCRHSSQLAIRPVLRTSQAYRGVRRLRVNRVECARVVRVPASARSSRHMASATRQLVP